MGFDVVAAYGTGIAGLAMAMVVLWMVWTRDLDAAVVNGVLVKTLHAKNVDRAYKLCKAAPESYLFAIEAAIARGRKGDDRMVIEANVYEAFDDKAGDLIKLQKARVEAGLAGVILSMSGLALAAYDGPIPRALMIIGGLAIGAGVVLLVRRTRLAKAIALARKEVLPVLVDALVEPEAPPAPTSPYREPSKPARVAALARPPAPILPADAATRPAAARPGTSLRDGTCPLCSGTTISRIDVDERFHKLVCAACGYTQEFADLTQLP